MISKYFNKIVFDISKIPPVIDPDILNNKTDFWYLKSHLYEFYSIVDDLFCEDEINKIIKLGNVYTEEFGKIGGNTEITDTNIRSCRLSWMYSNIYTNWIYQKLSDAINQVNEERFKFELTKLECLQFTKYKGNDVGFYEKHTDAMTGIYFPENRKLSVVIQLSDPSEYEGGDLCLFQGKNPSIIEKKKGRIVFFPSNILHEVTPVTKGTRYSLVAWAHGPAFK